MKVPAKLYQGNEILSNGQVRLSEDEEAGTYWPNNAEALGNYPSHGVTLRMTGKDHEIPITELELCSCYLVLHYHFLVQQKA